MKHDASALRDTARAPTLRLPSTPSRPESCRLRSRTPSPSGSGGKGSRPSQSLHGRMSFSDLSLNGGMVLQKDLSLSLLGSNLQVFTIAEICTVTRDFSIYKDYVDEKVMPGLHAQPIVVKLVDLEGN